jgi:uroporphyrinogen-III decarboxylase
MSPRERLLAALAGKPTDRVAWSPCTDAYFLSSLPPGEELDVAGLHRTIGSDALIRHVMLYSSTGPALSVRGKPSENPRVEVRIERTPRESYQIRYETPVGTLTEEFLPRPESPQIPWFIKRKLETVEDVKVYMYALETATAEPYPDIFARAVERLGDDGLVTTTAPASPMEYLINLEMGVENLTYALHDAPGIMEECFARMHEANLEAYRVIAESPAEVVISYENLSTTLTSPTNYVRFDREHCNDYADICHDAGKIYLTHMCGRLRGFAEPFAEVRQDGFIDVAPSPTGDVRFGEAKRTWARDRVLAGGIDATAFTSLSPEGIHRYVWDLLDEVRTEAGDLHKFILGSGDALPKGTPMPVLHAVSQAVRDFADAS